MQNDIYIRRVSGVNQNPDKTAVELFHFLTDLIKQFPQSPSWGPIDYVVVPKKTSLDQNDYVGFLAFKNRFVHFDVSNELRKIQPIEFGSRGMMVEINCHGTDAHQQGINRKKFQQNLNRFDKTKRYFDIEQSKKQSEPFQTNQTPDTSEKTINPFLTADNYIELINDEKGTGNSELKNNKVKRTAEQSQEVIETKKIRMESLNESSNDSFTNLPSFGFNKQPFKNTKNQEDELEKLRKENEYLKNRVKELEQTALSVQLEKISESTKAQKIINKLLKDREEANKASASLLALTSNFDQ
ncbi:unnamed protein product [Brachionus calyciflorus]|uniref:Uncharacterized protein n=1 Tax=Brachionus calyciflorus TaxID=104777 RepID=A0A814J5F8_9BILA|nr:unnamed protein product [Brachionus calyciflorus]